MPIANVVGLRGAKDKILDLIVGLVAIEMVDALAASQLSADGEFHNVSVLHDEAPPRKLDSNISTIRNGALAILDRLHVSLLRRVQ
jgi:hypothetical protein